MRVGNLVRRHEKGPDWRKGITALPLYPLTAALELKSALRVIVVQDVARDVIHRLRFADVRGLRADDHRELHFPVGFGTVLRNHDAVVRPRERARGFEEDDRLCGNGRVGLGGVIAKVETDAHDLARSRDGWTEAHAVRNQRAARRLAHEPAPHALESIRGEERLAVILAE